MYQKSSTLVVVCLRHASQTQLIVEKKIMSGFSHSIFRCVEEKSINDESVPVTHNC